MSARESLSKQLKEVHVLVTGFGEWPGYPTANPSYALTTHLPMHITTPTHKITISTHPTPIPVTYAAVDDLVPALHAARPDILLHVGVHAAGTSYALETRAWHSGYAVRDAAGALPSTPQAQARESAPSAVALAASARDVLARWTMYAPPQAQTSLSENAGLFLCEYLFYRSAVQALRADGTGAPLVAFMHVPGGSDGGAVRRGRDVCVALVRALVEAREGVALRSARL